jgi:hypothetical protein
MITAIYQNGIYRVLRNGLVHEFNNFMEAKIFIDTGKPFVAPPRMPSSGFSFRIIDASGLTIALTNDPVVVNSMIRLRSSLRSVPANLEIVS